MTIQGIPEVERNALGITDNLIRLSVGIEDIEDLIADVSQALETAVLRIPISQSQSELPQSLLVPRSHSGVGSEPKLGLNGETHLPTPEGSSRASSPGKDKFKTGLHTPPEISD
jgi:hypothetical protein